MAFYATLALIFILVIRPQEIWPVLEAFHLIDVATAIAAIGIVSDLSGKPKEPHSPQLPFLAGFLLLCYSSSLLLMGRDGWTAATNQAAMTTIFMLIVMYGARTFERLIAVSSLLVVLATGVAAVAVHQSQVDPVCIELTASGELEDGTPDGRVCATPSSCREGGQPGADYACERMGLFGTFSTGRRVRWRGEMDDPNEVAVHLAAEIPLLLALSAHFKKRLVSVAAVGVLALWLYAVVLTQSRGGQLAVATVLGIYFVSRFGAKGLFAAAAFAAPLLIFGGRDGEDAESSTEERIQILYEGVDVFLRHPLIGVGVSQFSDNISINMAAHNSYLLAATELGFPGLIAWSGLMWTSFKIPLTVLRRMPKTSRLYPYAMALVVSFAGTALGIFFLSYSYKQILFVWFGLAGAFYRVAKKEDPTFEVKVGGKDVMGLAAFGAFIIAFIFVYSRLKGGGG